MTKVNKDLKEIKHFIICNFATFQAFMSSVFLKNDSSPPIMINILGIKNNVNYKNNSFYRLFIRP